MMAKAWHRIVKTLSKLRIGSNKRDDEMSGAKFGRRSKKRKNDEDDMETSSEEDLAQATPAETTDSGLSLSSKRKKSPKPSTTDVQSCSSSYSSLRVRRHTHYVRIRKKKVLSKTRLAAGVESEMGDNAVKAMRPPSEHELRFSCELGDVWTEPFYSAQVSRHDKISAGDEYLDQNIHKLLFHGYVLHGNISSGSFGSVLLACSTIQHSNKFIALKFLLPETKTPEGRRGRPMNTFQNGIPDEILIHQKLSHPNIVEYLHFNNIGGRFYYTMEYCEHGNLEEMLQVRPKGFLLEPVARKYFRNMVSALQYLHQSNITHRNIKCANFLIDKQDQVKLCDFALARHHKPGDPLMRESVGEAAYQAPEMLRSKPHHPKVADIWSLGVVLYRMLTGNMPWLGLTEPDRLLVQMTKSSTILMLPENQQMKLSDGVRELFYGICTYPPSERYSLTRIVNSPWFNQAHTKVVIGCHYLTRQPQKLSYGLAEKSLKTRLGVL